MDFITQTPCPHCVLRRRRATTQAVYNDPVLSYAKGIDKGGNQTSDIDLVEINEAFSVVALANMKAWGSATT